VRRLPVRSKQISQGRGIKGTGREGKGVPPVGRKQIFQGKGMEGRGRKEIKRLREKKWYSESEGHIGNVAERLQAFLELKVCLIDELLNRFGLRLVDAQLIEQEHHIIRCHAHSHRDLQTKMINILLNIYITY